MLDRPANELHTAERDRRAAELIGRASDLVPLIERAGDRIERGRCLPDDVLDALHEARLFRLLIPRSYDGEEVEPAILFQVVQGGGDQNFAATVWSAVRLVLVFCPRLFTSLMAWA